MNKLRFALPALALVAVLGFAGQAANASFVYTVAPVSISTNFGAGSNLTLSAYNGGITSPTLSGNQIINLAQITQTSITVPPATDLASIPISLAVTIANQNGGGTSNFTVQGNFNVTRSDTQGAISTFNLTSILPPVLNLGSFQYTLSNITYAAPTIGGTSTGNGSLSVTITETVPEPASLAVLGLGAAALIARRRRA